MFLYNMYNLVDQMGEDMFVNRVPDFVLTV